MLEYKTYRKLIRKFLDDQNAIDKLFSSSNRVLKIGMYVNFLGWCEGKSKIKYKWKYIFFEEVLSRPEYYERRCWDKDFIVNTKIDSTGTVAGHRKEIVF